MDLTGKTAIVTGGGRDIGRACAIRLAKAGANVAINYYKSGDGAQSAVREIEEMGGRAFAIQGDMTDPEQVKAFVAAAAEPTA
nr:SDR family NAD(P)-dependent oxidoreductase [Limimaricola cinnabarinus]